MPVSTPTLPSPATTAQNANTPMSAGLVVVILAMLLGLQPITTDLYLPALPAMTSAARQRCAASRCNNRRRSGF